MLNDKFYFYFRNFFKMPQLYPSFNGSPTSEFVLSQGVRQGDPLSPFLFIIAMESLHIAMLEAVNKGYFQRLSLPSQGPSFSHFMFADDVIVLGKWTSLNAVNLNQILKCFNVASGLKVNFSKSKVFGLVHDDEIQNFSSFLNCDRAKLPFSYLGLTVGANMNLARNWKPLIDKVSDKLSLWKSKNLSFGGTLCKSVLGSLPLYFLSLFKDPIKLIDSIESIRRKFIWGVIDEGKNKIT